MKTIWTLILLTFLVVPATAQAQLDFDQEVIVIPEMHDVEPYIWQTSINPWDYRLSMEYDRKAVAGKDVEFMFTINKKTAVSLQDMHVFITDRGLNTFEHLRPAFINGKYRFFYNPPRAGKYRFEIVFRTIDGWTKISEYIRIKGSKKDNIREKNITDAGYSIKIKTVPDKIYSGHVSTFIYEIRYKGQPARDIEKIDGFDMQVAAWGESLRHFIYATPKQNIGGPEVAVSMVFTSPREYTIFSEFRHNGAIRRVKYVTDVIEEVIREPGIFRRNRNLYN